MAANITNSTGTVATGIMRASGVTGGSLRYRRRYRDLQQGRKALRRSGRGLFLTADTPRRARALVRVSSDGEGMPSTVDGQSDGRGLQEPRRKRTAGRAA